MISFIIRALLAAAVFLLPFGTRWIISPGNLNGYWEYGTVSLYVSEVFVVLAFAASILRSVVSFLRRQESILGEFGLGDGHLPSQVRHSKKALGIISVFILASLLIRGHNLGWSIHLTAAVLFSILLYRYRAHREQFLKVFVVSVVLQSLVGIIQIIFQRVPASTWLGTALQLPQTLGASVVIFHGARFLRAYGTFSHPNIFGAYMVVGFLMAVIFAMKDSARKYWWLIASLICSVGAMISFSRSVWISFGLVMGILFLKHRDSKVLRQGSVVMIILASIFVAVFYTTITARARVDGPLEVRSISERVSSTREAWQLFKRHPLLGVGGGNYTRAVHDELDSKRESWGYQPVHNVLLLVLVELGIIGVVALGILLFLYRPDIGLAFVALIPFILTDHFLWTLWPGLALFALVFGMTKPQDSKQLDAPAFLK